MELQAPKELTELMDKMEFKGLPDPKELQVLKELMV
jgi:hypothetical protein